MSYHKYKEGEFVTIVEADKEIKNALILSATRFRIHGYTTKPRSKQASNSFTLLREDEWHESANVFPSSSFTYSYEMNMLVLRQNSKTSIRTHHWYPPHTDIYINQKKFQKYAIIGIGTIQLFHSLWKFVFQSMLSKF